MKQNLQNKICLLALALLLCQAAGFAQVNTWTKVTTKQIGSWFYPAMAYSAGTKEYIVTMGWQDNFGQNGVYTVQSYQHKNGKWINSLPHDSLYGKWANLTGPAYGNGRTEDNVFGTPWWAFRTIDGYLRPSIGTVDGPYTYNQYCYNTDDGKIYYYVHDVTFTYDPASRLWDTLTVISQPTVGNPYNTGNQFDFSHYLKFGAMCYDGYNKEIVLFGGTGVENSTGSPGTWTFKPSTKTWSKLNLPLQPEPVAFSAMVYDPDNKVIVLFGGDRLDKLKNDTWIYNCITKTWTKKNPAIRPSPRQGHAMLFFPKSRKIVLAGGNNYSGNIPELWTYNVGLNTWQLIKRDNPATSLINYSEGQIQIMSLNCAVDKGDTLIVLADSAYRANGYHFTPQTYRMVCDASVVDAAGTTTYGLTSDTVIYLSNGPSYYTTGVTPPDTAANEAFLRNLPLNKWTALTQPKMPKKGRSYSTTILDTDRDIILKWAGGHDDLCENDVPHYTITNNRYTSGYYPEYPITWNRAMQPAPGPYTFNGRPYMPPHPESFYAYDVKAHLMVYVWGYYTWLYDPDSMDWKKNLRIYNPFDANNFNVSLISTPRGVFCIYDDRTGSATGKKNFLFNATTRQWDQLPLTGNEGNYYSRTCGIAYDSKRDRILNFNSGANNGNYPIYTYEYSFGTGVGQAITATNTDITKWNPEVREALYIPELDKVLFQVQYNGEHIVFNCATNAWETLAISGYPVPLGYQNASAIMYDPKRHLVWLSDYFCNIYVARLTPLTTEVPELNATTASLLTSPNPFSSQANITVSGLTDVKNATLQVFNIQGKLVADLTDQLPNKNITFNAYGLSEGLYLVRLNTGNNFITKKINYKK